MNSFEERHDPNFITNVASNLLSDKYGGRIHLRKSRTFTTDGSIVIRCGVIGSGSDIPASVIIKKVREDEIAYYPDKSETPNSAHWLLNDWAAAAFLSNVPK